MVLGVPIFKLYELLWHYGASPCYRGDVCRVPKCPTALNVRQILFFSKSVILVTKININIKISKYFKKIISEKYSESNLEKKLPDI